MIMVECLIECGGGVGWGGVGCWIAQFKTCYEHLKGAARQGHLAAVSTNTNIVQVHRPNWRVKNAKKLLIYL